MQTYNPQLYTLPGIQYNNELYKVITPDQLSFILMLGRMFL